MKMPAALLCLTLLAALPAAAQAPPRDAVPAAMSAFSSDPENAAVPCDLNRDGRTDVLDLLAGIQSLFGSGPYCDLDCDGTATILDLQLLVNGVLGGNCPPDCPLTSRFRPAIDMGHAELRIFFTPNPVVDDGTGRFRFDVYLTETQGVSVTLTDLTVGSDTTNRIDQIVPSHRIEAGGTLIRNYVHISGRPIEQTQDLRWEIRGNDAQGHDDLVWRGSLRMVPFTSSRYGHLAAFFEPNPATPTDAGSGSNLLVLQETNDVGITLTGMIIDGLDASNLIREPRIPPGGALGAIIDFPSGAAPGEHYYVFQGNDDHGHTGLTWSAVNRLQAFVQLLSSVPREHRLYNAGDTPFQFRVFVPQGSAALVIRMEGPPAPDNVLTLYARAALPVEPAAGGPFSDPQADFRLTQLGTGSLRIDAVSTPPLRTGTSYYLAVRRASGTNPLTYTITASLDR